MLFMENGEFAYGLIFTFFWQTYLTIIASWFAFW